MVGSEIFTAYGGERRESSNAFLLRHMDSFTAFFGVEMNKTG
jgi:hypothetical protein